MKFREHFLSNWHQYQGHTKKDLPWSKVWGALFRREWWQELSDDEKIIPIILIDHGRVTGGLIRNKYAFFARNYGLKLSRKRWHKVVKSLLQQGFLSNSLVGPIRQDKSRVDKSLTDGPLSNDQKNDVKALIAKVLNHSINSEANEENFNHVMEKLKDAKEVKRPFAYALSIAKNIGEK